MTHDAVSDCSQTIPCWLFFFNVVNKSFKESFEKSGKLDIDQLKKSGKLDIDQLKNLVN